MEYYRNISLISFSKEFRRLKDKTQLFNTGKGDHYRTRLTHTMEVCSIALEIANQLRYKNEKIKLNDSLITAISLGHDIGHTPFGHVGERAITDILNGTFKARFIKENTVEEICFKHNVNSFRILSSKPFRVYNAPTVMISWKVLDGVLKHTDVYKVDANEYEQLSDERKDDPYDINKLLRITTFDSNKLCLDEFFSQNVENYFKLNHSLTLEGQIVAIADEIAQRIADLDDIFRAGFKDIICSNLENIKNSQFYIKNLNILTSISGNNFNDIDRVCNALKKYLIKSVYYSGAKKDCNKSDTIFVKKCIYFTGEEVETRQHKIDGEGAYINEIFKKIAKETVISPVISEYDNDATKIIQSLFAKYCNHVYLLNNNGLDDITDDIIEYGRSQGIIFSNKNVYRDRKIKIIKVLRKYCNGEITEGNAKSKIDSMDIDDKFKRSLNSLICERHIRPIHSIILRNVGNYIAGMTDKFAKSKMD